MRDKCSSCGVVWPRHLKEFRQWAHTLTCAGCAAELQRRVAYAEADNDRRLDAAQRSYEAMLARRAAGLGPTAAESMRDLYG